MPDDALPSLLRWMSAHPLIAFVIVTAVFSVAKSIFEAAAKTRSRTEQKPGAQRSAPASDEDDLEARVRRNFEEMMRRRSQQQPEPPPPAAALPAASARRTSAPRSRVDYDTLVRGEPTSTEGPRARREPTSTEGTRAPAIVRGPTARSTHLEAAQKAVAGTLRTAAAARGDRRARVAGLRRFALERASLRRVILLREILDPPVALRE